MQIGTLKDPETLADAMARGGSTAGRTCRGQAAETGPEETNLEWWQRFERDCQAFDRHLANLKAQAETEGQPWPPEPTAEHEASPEGPTVTGMLPLRRNSRGPGADLTDFAGGPVLSLSVPGIPRTTALGSLGPAKVDECLLVCEAEDALPGLEVTRLRDELVPSRAGRIGRVRPDQGEAMTIECCICMLEQPGCCTVRSPDHLCPLGAQLRQRGDCRIDVVIGKAPQYSA